MTLKADSVSFTAQGKTWTVRLTPGAWIEIEDAGLGNVQDLAKSLQADPSFKKFVRVLEAGLRFETPSITPEQAIALADEIGSEETIAVVSQAIQASFPSTAGKAGNGTKAKA